MGRLGTENENKCFAKKSVFLRNKIKKQRIPSDAEKSLNIFGPLILS
jgi:hypothetical protein